MIISDDQDRGAPRFLRYEKRVQVVAIYAVPQSEEPPGRDPYRERVDVLASSGVPLTFSEVAGAIDTARAVL